MSASPPDERAIVLTPRLLWALGSVAAIIGGSLGPWVTFGAISVSGTGDGRDGGITLILGVVAAVLVVTKRARPAVGLVAAAALAVSVIDGVQVLRSREDTIIGSIDIGWGLLVLVAGAASLLAWTISEYIRRGAHDRVRIWAIAGTVVVLVVTVGALAASGRFDTLDGGKTSNAEGATDSTNAAEESKPKATCDALGINSKDGGEGACVTDNGTRVQVANRDSLLRLDDVNVRIVDIRTASELTDLAGEPVNPAGRFVRVTLEIHNNTNAPIDISSSMFALTAAGKTNEPDSDILIDGEIGGQTIGPDLSRTGDVVFDVSQTVAESISTDGNFLVFQPSDDGAPDAPSKRVGVFRTYGTSPAASPDAGVDQTAEPCKNPTPYPPGTLAVSGMTCKQGFALIGNLFRDHPGGDNAARNQRKTLTTTGPAGTAVNQAFRCSVLYSNGTGNNSGGTLLEVSCRDSSGDTSHYTEEQDDN